VIVEWKIFQKKTLTLSLAVTLSVAASSLPALFTFLALNFTDNMGLARFCDTH